MARKVLWIALKVFAHFFVANTINTHFFVAKPIYALFLSEKEFMHTIFVAKMIYAFFCRKNDLRTSSGKFLRVESCHPESSDFLGLWLLACETSVNV